MLEELVKNAPNVQLGEEEMVNTGSVVAPEHNEGDPNLNSTPASKSPVANATSKSALLAR